MTSKPPTDGAKKTSPIKVLFGLCGLAVGGLLLVQNPTLQKVSIVQKNTEAIQMTAADSRNQSQIIVIHDNKTGQARRTTPRLYVCGFDLWNFYKGVFPDLEFGGRLDEIAVTTSIYQDVLLHVGLDGPCSVALDQIQSDFHGKVLFVNTEPRKGGSSEKQRLSERFFKLGPSEDPRENRTLPAYFGAIFLYSTTTVEQRNWILEDHHSQKQRGGSNYRHNNAMVFLVSNCLPQRREAATELSKVVPVHYGPKCIIVSKSDNNSQRIPKLPSRNRYVENWKLYSNYKYCLVMENSQTSGYITEKLILAFLGGCLPIYWGTPEVFQVFHSESFLFYDTKNPQATLDRVQYLQENDTAYQEILLHQPILAANVSQTIDDYFSFADDVGTASLKRKIRRMLGLK